MKRKIQLMLAGAGAALVLLILVSFISSRLNPPAHDHIARESRYPEKSGGSLLCRRTAAVIAVFRTEKTASGSRFASPLDTHFTHQ
jgi:hypothetical protein